MFFRPPDPIPEDDYQRLVEEGTGMALTSMASVPLLSGDTTTGCIGFIKFGIKDWSPEELNALKAIASLFARCRRVWSPRTSCATWPSMTT